MENNSNLNKQGRIQSKFEGEAVGIGGAENFSETGDESALYTKV